MTQQSGQLPLFVWQWRWAEELNWSEFSRGEWWTTNAEEATEFGMRRIKHKLAQQGVMWLPGIEVRALPLTEEEFEQWINQR